MRISWWGGEVSISVDKRNLTLSKSHLSKRVNTVGGSFLLTVTNQRTVEAGTGGAGATAVVVGVAVETIGEVITVGVEGVVDVGVTGVLEGVET
jgi:hypothetical protein